MPRGIPKRKIIIPEIINIAQEIKSMKKISAKPKKPKTKNEIEDKMQKFRFLCGG